MPVAAAESRRQLTDRAWLITGRSEGRLQSKERAHFVKHNRIGFYSVELPLCTMIPD